MESPQRKYVSTFALTCRDHLWPDSKAHINLVLTEIVGNDLDSSYQYTQQVAKEYRQAYVRRRKREAERKGEKYVYVRVPRDNAYKTTLAELVEENDE